MGVIFLDLGSHIKIFAVGGKMKILTYFRKALPELLFLSRLLNAKLHICLMDREAWEQFIDNDIEFISSNIAPISYKGE